MDTPNPAGCPASGSLGQSLHGWGGTQLDSLTVSYTEGNLLPMRALSSSYKL